MNKPFRFDTGRAPGARWVPLLLAGLLLWQPAQGAQPGMSLPGDYRPFAEHSPWNQPIGPDPRLMPGSALIVARLARKAGRLKADHRQWSIPLFVIDAEATPKVRVNFSRWSHPLLDPAERGYVDGIPLPDTAWPDPKPDGHLLLVDPLQARAWDFSRLKRLESGWQASRVETWDLTGSGDNPPFEGPRWWTRGARGSGMPLFAGLVRPEQITAGEIPHALVFASPITRKSNVPEGPLELCRPASRSDGTVIGADTLPMGARLQLDPALDLDALGLSPAVKVMARAMQRYGLYNGDSTHDVFKIYLQNLGSNAGFWGRQGLETLGNIPMEAFRVLACDTLTRDDVR